MKKEPTHEFQREQGGGYRKVWSVWRKEKEGGNNVIIISKIKK